MSITFESVEKTRPEISEADAEQRLLDEAMRLTGLHRPSEVVRLALKELVERQRFLSWVAAHERGGDRSGNA